LKSRLVIINFQRVSIDAQVMAVECLTNVPGWTNYILVGARTTAILEKHWKTRYSKAENKRHLTQHTLQNFA